MIWGMGEALTDPDASGQPRNAYWGFGCFHFGLKASPPAGWTVGDYINELTRTLRGIAPVDRVQVTVPPDVLGEELLSPDEPLRIGDGEPPFPYLQFGEVDIDLVIPAGVQEDVSTLGDGVPPLYTERFNLQLRYQYRLPIAVVRLTEPASKPEASYAVHLLWKLLEREFGRLTDTQINFQFLGPSPMHADFELAPGSATARSGEWSFYVDRRRQRGYDAYSFTYNKARFADVDEALEVLIDALCREADVFYYEMATQVSRMRSWSELREHADSLIDLEGASGVRGFVNRWFTSARRIREVAVELARYESGSVMGGLSVRDDYRDAYAMDDDPYLKEMVDEGRASSWDFPTKDIRDLVDLFEQRRLWGVETNAGRRRCGRRVVTSTRSPSTRAFGTRQSGWPIGCRASFASSGRMF